MELSAPHVVSVSLKSTIPDPKGKDLALSIRRFLGIQVDRVQTVRVYRIFKPFSEEDLKSIAEHVLLDQVSEHTEKSDLSFDWSLEIRLKPGLTDNLGITAQISIEDFLRTPFAPKEWVQSAVRYLLKGNLSRAEVEKIGRELLANPLIEEIYSNKLSDIPGVIEKTEIGHCGQSKTVRGTVFEQSSSSDFSDAADRLGAHKKASSLGIEEIDLSADLLEISQTRGLALNLAEMEAIKAYYAKECVREERKRFGLSSNPTDAEIEAIAQTWSEHCKHKIFQARINYVEDGKKTAIDSIFSTYIKRATEEISKKIDWLVSVFKDNAGIIRFHKSICLSCKVETHNSPSALDPYGGSLTGILGVNRDIFGTGFGSRPIANMDVLCFAPPDYAGPIPEKLLHPKRVLSGVCKGIEHGGNKSGIPTVNGSVLFDERFLGKPLVYCGTIGLMPAAIGSRKCEEKKILPGDLIALAGGKTGKDGIHGATFSSEELHEKSPASAVQIGDPFTQKKLHDFLLEARDLGLYRTLTDNGAGGLSSSVGEMARTPCGCEIHLDRVPLKYPNLSPWEILLSESQERMTFAVPRECKEELANLAAFHEVDFAILGTFTESGRFHALFEGKTVALLDLDFLHEGVPQLQIDAEWNTPVELQASLPPSNLGKDLHGLLSRFTICSKETIVRQFDHEVQGGSCLKPFVGVLNDGPGDASIVLPIELQKDGVGIVVSNGICPRYSEIDTYSMASCALSEAICNQVAVGADPFQIAILDNFCWPDPIYDPVKTPDGKHKMAQLIRASVALYRGAVDLETPIISGKDSMKNDYKMKGVKISIPPTLLITAVGKIPSVKKAVSMDVKASGDLVYIAGWTRDELGGSEYLAMKKCGGGKVPKVDFLDAKILYRAIFEAMQEETVASCHDCSEGGMGVALAESAFAGGLGLEIDLGLAPMEEKLQDAEILFSESANRFVITVDPRCKARFEAKMRNLPYAQVGVVRKDSLLVVRGNSGRHVIEEDIFQLKASWQEPLRKL